MYRPLPTCLSAAAALLAPAAVAAQAGVTTADYTFDYTYPAAVTAFSPLRAWLERDKAAARAKVAKASAAFRRETTRDGFPFRRYESTTEWKVVSQTPRFLSLSGEFYTYQGGAHGGTKTLSLVWDKARRQRLEPMALFTSPAALDRATRTAFCRGLDAERTRRRGGGAGVPDDPFNKCPPLSDLVLLLGSTNGRAIDRLGLIADQYVAGSYAEGIYEVTLPVTPAVLSAVKPPYRAAFAAR